MVSELESDVLPENEKTQRLSEIDFYIEEYLRYLNLHSTSVCFPTSKSFDLLSNMLKGLEEKAMTLANYLNEDPEEFMLNFANVPEKK
jgi:hypothetical protein